MGWNMDNQGGKSSSGQAFVKEGNIDVFMFSEKETKVRFLTENVDIEQIMEEKKITREEAVEYVNTELIFKKWIMPISYWEHTIPQIQGQRYFSTQICQGKRACPLCFENEAAKNNGVTENKLLPYPVRKRFYVPAYFYDLQKVLFVKASQDYFEEIAKYINKNDGPVDFEIYRSGKGFGTKYHSTFIGAASNKEKIEVGLSPEELDFTATEKEIQDKISTRGFVKHDSESGETTDTGSAGDFKIPFGEHKGKSIHEVYQIDEKYINFLLENSSGVIQDKVKAYLDELR